MTATPLNVGLIGFGAAGSVFHAPLVSAEPRLRLAAIVTSDPQRQAQARATFPEAAIVSDVERLWAEDLDLVVVATPNRTHAPLATAAIERGVAAVVDKPLAVTSTEARALIDLAASRDTPLTVFQNRRWDTNFLTAAQLAASGDLGTPYRLELRHERWRPRLKGGWRELGDPSEAGGLLYDLGAHLIDQAVQLLGPVADIHAELDTRRAGAQADDDVFLALRHTSGARSHLTMTVLTPNPDPLFRLSGERGTFVMHGFDPQEDQLRAGRKPRSPGWGIGPVGVLETDGASEEIATLPGRWEDFYEGVALALLGERPAPPVDPRDALATLTVIEEARRMAAGR